MRHARLAVGVAVVLTGALGGCTSAPRAPSIGPTLQLSDVPGGRIAVQNGIPVPTFDWQPRRRLDLTGTWRVQRHAFDADLSLAPRSTALAQITREAGNRQGTAFDDRSWSTTRVPGTLNPPPASPETGGWYRFHFTPPATWSGLAVTLKFGAVNYVADVWLNGTYLGYHEGGYTPFAFDVTASLRAGVDNVLALRVDNPAWGTRDDIVPWGLGDWWNYGGITRPVWLEAAGPVQAVRADVVPHLDGADVSVVVWNQGSPAPGVSGSPVPGTPSATATVTPTASGTNGAGSGSPAPGASGGSASPTASPAPNEVDLRVEVLPAQVTPQNEADPDVRALIPGGSTPLATASTRVTRPQAGDATVAHVSFLFSGADAWSPAFPALYVLHTMLSSPSGDVDGLWTTFGLRRVSVHPQAPSVLLNGARVFLHGVGLHDESLVPGAGSGPQKGSRVNEAATAIRQLAHARQIGANLVRTGHTPANPLLLMLTDRLGFGVWEEIPLYHFTPPTFQIAMARGIPQQMLEEMVLRDFNRPSVLFHGLANESLGGSERSDALTTLAALDRQLDGTRLTGQAAYGSQPDDPTQAPLDVAGFTFYYGVFYGTDAADGTAQALEIAHRTNPSKPVIALEFGRWSDGASGKVAQRHIFEETYPEFSRRADVLGKGYVAGAVWWTLEDFLTKRPGISVERFGLFAPDGMARIVARSIAAAWGPGGGHGADLQIRSGLTGATQLGSGRDPLRDWRLVAYLAYGLAVPLLMLALVTLFLVRRGGRASAPRRS